jgi:hypothetical protein
MNKYIMEPITAMVVATILITKALEKSGEKLGELVIDKVGQSINKIRQHSPETAIALEAGDTDVLNLDRAMLTQLPVEPIFTELLDAADSEQNAKFKEKFQALKTDSMINIIGKQINITQGGTSNTQINKNTFNF